MQSHLVEKYGHTIFRANQQDIIEALIGHNSVLAVMPTGAGKSLLYQFYATFTKSVSVVVSPLISLMNDQRLSLKRLGISSVCLNSETTLAELKALREAEVVFVTPENLVSDACLLWSSGIEIGLFAIDEAHCISQWSHDFRPAYQRLSMIKDRQPDVPVLAVTATATPSVVEELKDVLQIAKCKVYLGGTHRDNLRISVRPKSGFDTHVFEEQTIVYVQTRKVCEDICARLQKTCAGVAMYHGGLSKKQKTMTHEKFAEGSLKVVIATISFGMGINKSDIRHVINYGVPTDLETYYQEIGRAGRDGLESRATIFYSYGDFATANSLIITSACPEQRRIKLRALGEFKKYLAETTACRQSMIDYYFKHGNINVAAVRNLQGCKLCDNCCGTRKSVSPSLDRQHVAIVAHVADHRRKNGYGVGITKTIKCLREQPVFASFTKKRIRQCLEEALNLGYISQSEVRTKSGRTVFVLVNGSVAPPALPVEPLETTLRQRLLDFRTQKSNRMCMPTEFVLSDCLLEELLKQPDNPEVLAKVTSSWRNLVRLLISDEKRKFSRRCQDNVKKIYKEANSVSSYDNARKLASEVLDVIEKDENAPIYLSFFDVTEEIENLVLKTLDRHEGSSDGFIAKKAGSTILEYQVRVIKLAHSV